MSAKKLSVLALCGSLRKKSYNHFLLDTAAALAPADMEITRLDLGALPMFNQDLEDNGKFPAPVTELRARVAQADAMLIASPEYNYSISPVIKNALDWASRPPNQPLSGKPVALMGASMSTGGSVRAQMALRQVFVYVNMLPLNRPELLIAKAQDKFDADGTLTDAELRKRVGEVLVALGTWTRQLATK